MRDLLENLTDAQREAVQHVAGPLLILAGPGSGKTRVVTHRIAHLLRTGIPARQILALTFTNKAADEMRARLQVLAPGQSVWVGTFHGFCARLLRQYAPMVGLSENYSILDTDDSLRLLKQAIANLGLDLIHSTPDQIARRVSWAKNQLIGSEQFVPRSGDPLGSLMAQVYPEYQQRLLASNCVDFDDLLLHVATLLRENAELRADLDARYRYILVDEYQDTNLAQYSIVRALSIDYPNLAVTGDPDQSIYGWRGANLNNILEFEHDFPDVKVVRLEQNYRSTPSILRVADQLIANNVRRKQKKLFTTNEEGPPVRLVVYPDASDEAEHIAHAIAERVSSGQREPKDFAVFFRVNALSRLIEHALRRYGIPYQIVQGQEFYHRAEIRDLLAYLHLLNNPAHDTAFLRVINTPPRAIGATTIKRIAEHARERNRTLLEAARESGLIKSLNKRAAVAVARFVAMYDKLQLYIHQPLAEILNGIIEETGYREWLQRSKDEEDQQRLANVFELVSEAAEFDVQHGGEGALERYLEQSALVSDTDAWQAESNKVSLMTLHAAKGLEFPCVFVIGVEQGLLPHSRSKDDPESFEEERRLLFVGITRAERELQISMAAQRSQKGRLWPTVASPFLMELPREEMEVIQLAPSLSETDSPGGEFDEYAQDEPSYEEPFFAVDSEPEITDFEPETVDSGEEENARPSLGKLITASQMLGGSGSSRGRTDPGVFRQGMIVNHPEYGMGTITNLSGHGTKRTATVRFFTSSEPRTFRIAFSELQPVRSQ